VNIGVLGLPVREHMLVWSRDDGVARRLGLERAAPLAAPQGLIDDRQRIIDQLAFPCESVKQLCNAVAGVAL
jgi:hypothetical protein